MTTIEIDINNRAFIQDRPQASPKALPVPDHAGTVSPAGWVYYDVDNFYPQRLQNAMRASTVVGKSITTRAALHYGRGPMMYDTLPTDDGKQVKRLQWPDEVAHFWRKSRMTAHFPAIIRDYETFGRGWAHVVLDRGRKRVNRVFHVDASLVRVGEYPESASTETQMAYLSADWPKPAEGEYKTYPIIDPDYPELAFQIHADETEFFYPVSRPTTGQVYYPSADWHAAFEAGWMDVAAEVPQLKKHMFRNQMGVKYVFYIHDRYWAAVYGDDFDTWSADEQRQKRQALKDRLEESMAGSENAQKSIVSGKWFDPKSGQTERYIDVEVIDDKMRDGAFLPDSASANSEILYTLIDPSILGHGIPGGKDLAGSGSDKRLSFQIAQQIMYPDQLRTLDLLQFIGQINEWPAYDWAYQAVDISQTLDQNPTGNRQII